MASRSDVEAASTEERVGPPPISMEMDIATARTVADWLAEQRGTAEADRLCDVLWLRAVFLGAQRGLSAFERARLRDRADRLLLQLLD